MLGVPLYKPIKNSLKDEIRDKNIIEKEDKLCQLQLGMNSETLFDIPSVH